MEANIDEIVRKKEKVTYFLFILYENTLMTRPDLWPLNPLGVFSLGTGFLFMQVKRLRR
jgi:hypothetical protein